LFIDPKIIAKMVLRRRARNFTFRPRLFRRNGMDHIVVRNGPFHTEIALRANNVDLKVFQQIFLQGQYDINHLHSRAAEMRALYERTERPLIVDLGANIGLASLYFSIVWPRAAIIAVEPDDENFALLKRNAPSAICVAGAVTSEKCRVTIANRQAGPWAYRTQADANGNIEGLTVIELLGVRPDDQPFICKIDIEGAESELFSKNLDWLTRFPLIAVETHDWMLPSQGNARNFLRAISHLDRDFLFVGETIWSIANSIALPDQR
jgi:FkbM family methyltransferase